MQFDMLKNYLNKIYYQTGNGKVNKVWIMYYKCQPNCHEFESLHDRWKEIMFQYPNINF